VYRSLGGVGGAIGNETGTTIHSTARAAYLYVGVDGGFSLGLLPICTTKAERCAQADAAEASSGRGNAPAGFLLARGPALRY
jgi:hypothetical protein